MKKIFAFTIAIGSVALFLFSTAHGSEIEREIERIIENVKPHKPSKKITSKDTAVIPKHTFSMEGWSNTFIGFYNMDGASSNKSSLDLLIGYFPTDNFEVGLGLYFENEEFSTSDGYERAYGLGPTFVYHFPLSGKTFFYLGGGLLYHYYEKEV